MLFRSPRTSWAGASHSASSPAACGASPSCPAVTCQPNTLPAPSPTTWSLLVFPPRLRPTPCSPFFFQPRCRAGGPAQPRNLPVTAAGKNAESCACFVSAKPWPTPTCPCHAIGRTARTPGASPPRGPAGPATGPRHGAPVRPSHNTASTKPRVAAAVTPQLPAWPGKRGDNSPHILSVSNVRSAFIEI